MIHRDFTIFPTLTTERLVLRQLMLEDDQDLFAIRSDAEINKYLERQPSKTIEDARDFIRKITEGIQKNECIYWVIALSENQTFVGTICLFELSDEQKKCEIGYELLSKYQGKGIMLEAANKVIEYAQHTMKVSTIEAFTHKNNQGSTKLLEKLQFKKSPEPDKTNPDFCAFIL